MTKYLCSWQMIVSFYLYTGACGMLGVLVSGWLLFKNFLTYHLPMWYNPGASLQYNIIKAVLYIVTKIWGQLLAYYLHKTKHMYASCCSGYLCPRTLPISVLYGFHMHQLLLGLRFQNLSCYTCIVEHNPFQVHLPFFNNTASFAFPLNL